MKTNHFISLALLTVIAVCGPTAVARAADASAADQTPPTEPKIVEPNISVKIDAAKPGAPINPLIYSQFIEHLGRCIYGGIWAEMLEDRKFYFQITEKYDPYRSLKDSKFPVVGASPWEVLGPAGSVTMEKTDPFVGDQTPQVAAGSGIRQSDLGLVAGKEYTGYIWLKAPQGTASVDVALVWGDGDSGRKSIPIADIGNEYKQYPLKFTAGAATDHGRLEIHTSGGPVLIGTVSVMPGDNIRGMRRDTIALLKQLNAPAYRWPGGNFVSGYDWRDGIGPRDRRPPRRNPAWTGVEHNDFGIDEFLDFCHEIQTQPIIAANTGFGDPYSAAQEVEYCNASPETIGGSWRVKNGHAEPYKVKLWCVGNEMFGVWQLGFMRLDQYTEKHNRTAKAMHKVDPTLTLIGSGDLGTRSPGGRRGDGAQRGWSEGMLQDCADNMDLLSEHFYVRTPSDDIPKHADLIAKSIRGKVEGQRKLQASLPNLHGRVIPIAMDEWNYWYEPYEYGELGCVYRLRDALGIAAGLHEYFRNSDLIQMANYAQTVNVIGCIKTTKTAAFLDTTALPLIIYHDHFGTLPLAIEGNQSEASLDISAAKTADERALTIAVVNPNAKPKEIHLDLGGLKVGDKANLWQVAGDDPLAINTADKQSVAIHEEKDAAFGDTLTVPPYSDTIYRVEIK